MISPKRFRASKSLDESLWLDVKRQGVSATDVAKASTEAGFREVVDLRKGDMKIEDNRYMQFGRDQEPHVAMWLKDNLGIMPNDWVISHHETPEYMATPDGLSMDHRFVAEIKTTGKDWDPNKIPIQYRRQVQWQLYVTGAEYAVFAWLLRVERDGVFVPGWFEPKHTVIDRDEEHIQQLKTVADNLLEALNG
jgi:putative phage-type endonuclease